MLHESASEAESKNLWARGEEMSRRWTCTDWSQRFNYFNYLSSFSFPKKEAIKGCPFGLIWLKKQDGGRDERLQMSVLIRGVKTAICELGRLIKWIESVCSVCVCVCLDTLSFPASARLFRSSCSVDKLWSAMFDLKPGSAGSGSRQGWTGKV